MEKLHREIFDKVLFVGPDYRANGGMASVLASYRAAVEPFHYLPTNSRRGTLAGFVACGVTLLSLPFQRLLGRRILHIHYASGKSLMRKRVVQSWGRLWGFRTIMHCHCNLTGAIDRHGVGTMRRVLGHADCNIALAQTYADDMHERLGLTAEVVNNPIEPMPAARKAAPGTPTTFIFLGLLSEAKGFFNLLEALGALKARGLRFRLIVGGAGDVAAMNAAIERLGLADSVDFRGWMTGSAKEAALAEADVVVLPSLSEGMPVCILEAIASQKAAVATAVGAVPQLVDDGRTGFVVAPGNVAELTDALAAYASDPALAATHGKAAGEKINDFLPAAVIDRLGDIYKRLLS